MVEESGVASEEDGHHLECLQTESSKKEEEPIENRHAQGGHWKQSRGETA